MVLTVTLMTLATGCIGLAHLVPQRAQDQTAQRTHQEGQRQGGEGERNAQTAVAVFRSEEVHGHVDGQVAVDPVVEPLDGVAQG